MEMIQLRSCFCILFVPTVWSMLLNENVKRCPTRHERQLLSSRLCNSISGYHCLYDDEMKLVETCNSFIQLPPGHYPRYTSFADRIFYEECPHERYQPWPVKSYEIAECELLKSTCSGIGQVPCGSGNLNTDATCGCDYTKGYVMYGSTRCCSPSGSKDCHCEYRPCRNVSQELNSDYVCVSKCLDWYQRPPGQTDCILMPDSSSRIPTWDNSTPAHTTISSIAIGTIASINEFWSIQAIVGTLLTCILIIVAGTGYGVYILWTHDIVKERIYNEEYAVQVFKFLKAAAEDKIPTLKMIKNQRYIDMNDTDYNRRTALHLAACEGKYKAVQYLLRNNIGYLKAKDRMERTALEDAEWHLRNKSTESNKGDYARVIDLLKHPGVLTNSETIHFRDTQALKLMKAAENSHLDGLIRYFQLGTDMNLPDTDGRTALHVAAEKGQESVVNFLLDKCEVSPFVRWRGLRPSELAKKNKEIKEKLEKVMDEQIIDDNVPKFNESAYEDDTIIVVKLLNSASRGDIRQIKSLVRGGCLMSLADYDDRTALHVAVSEMQEHVVEYLLKECGLADDAEKKEDRWRNTPLMLAKEEGKEKLFRIFLANCPNIINTESDEYKTFTLLTAGSKGDLATLKKLFESGVDMNLQDYDGRTALHLAVDGWKENTSEATKFEKAIEFLIVDCNCNVNMTDRYGRTPQSQLEKDGNRKETFQTMVFSATSSEHTMYADNNERESRHDTGKEIKRVNFGSKTFSKKKTEGKTFTFKGKYRKKASKITDRSNMYAMHEAAGKGDIESLKRCDYPYLDASDYLKNTPLHLAAANGHLEVVKYLLDNHKVSPFIKNNSLKTAKDLVQEQIDVLVNRPATEENIKQRKRFSDIRKSLNTVMKSQIEETNIEPDPSFRKLEKDVQIFVLLNKAYKGDIVSIRRYMKSDPNIINKTDYDKRSALHIAVAEQHEHLVKYLLKELGDVIETEVVDRWGNTPRKDAVDNGYKEIVKMFIDMNRNNP